MTGQSFSMQLESVDGIDQLETIPRASLNITCSPVDFGTYLSQTCPYSTTHSLFCDASAVGVWEITCPEVTSVMQCQSVRTVGSSFEVNDEECIVTSMSGTSIACDCPMSTLYSQLFTETADQSLFLQRHLRNSSLNDSAVTTEEDSLIVEVEFTAMINFVVEDFVTTWSSVDDLSKTNLNESKKVLLTLGFLVFFIFIGLFVSEDADKKHMVGIGSGSKKKVSPSEMEQSESKKNSIIDIDALFPVILMEDPFIYLFCEQLKKSHRWASIFFNYDEKFPRVLRFLCLSSVVICTLFFNSLLLPV